MKRKTCIKCNETKPYKYFYKNKREKDGLDYYCKICRVGTALKSHRGGVRKKKCSIEECESVHYAKSYCRNHYTRLYRHGTTNLLNTRKKKTYDVAYQRAVHLRNTFKLTVEKYEEMAKDGCHICGKEALPYKYLHVDHDHNCCPGKRSCGLCVRGILCDACNGAVGQYENDNMRDDYPLKNEVLMYVAKHNWLISDRIMSNDKKQGNR